jgi:hypothetical protein
MLPSKLEAREMLPPLAMRELGNGQGLECIISASVEGVDKLYHQLVEIHAIATTQLAECTHWLPSDSTPSPV